MSESHNRKYKWLYLLFGAAFFIYVAARAVRLSFTHDECLSFRYLHYSVLQLLSNDTGTDLSANNHILNTLAMKLLYAVGGSSEPVLRLHSVLACVVYLVYAYRFLCFVRNDALGLCGFMLLVANPYLLDFFSLARGYGLACAFMLMSLYHFTRFLQSERTSQLVYSGMGMCFTVLANFALTLFCVALLMVLFIAQAAQVVTKRKSFTGACAASLPALLPIGTMVWAYLAPIKALYRGNQLDFGYSTGFWADTVRTLIDTYLYEMPYHATVGVALNWLAVVCCVMFPTAIVVLFATNRKAGIKPWHITVLMVSYVTCGLSVVQHHLWGTAYLQERFAIFLYPLFILALVAVADIGLSFKRSSRVAGAITVLLACCSALHFLLSANLSYSLNWRYDADTKKMLNDLSSIVRADGKQNIRFGPYWYFEPTVNFYRAVKQLSWMQPVDRSWPDKEYDYHYISEKEYAKRTDMNGRKIVSKKVLVRYPVSQNVLCVIETTK